MLPTRGGLDKKRDVESTLYSVEDEDNDEDEDEDEDCESKKSKLMMNHHFYHRSGAKLSGGLGDC